MPWAAPVITATFSCVMIATLDAPHDILSVVGWRLGGMRIGVVGGGIAGLAAAHRLTERVPEAEIVLFEQGPVLGGKLRTTTIAGGLVERGAEAFVTTDPSAVDLASAVGLGPALTRPTPAKAALAVGGVLRDIPTGTFMGIPMTAVPGALDEPAPTPLLAPGADVAVGALVRPRRGDDAVDTYVEPLLGGVYAGRADALSLRMAVPALATAAESAHTLTEALAAATAARAGAGAPGFATLVGGMSRLVEAVAGRLPDVRLEAAVRELHPTRTGWRLVAGATRAPSTVDCDAVVLAVPAAP